MYSPRDSQRQFKRWISGGIWFYDMKIALIRVLPIAAQPRTFPELLESGHTFFNVGSVRLEDYIHIVNIKLVKFVDILLRNSDSMQCVLLHLNSDDGAKNICHNDEK